MSRKLIIHEIIITIIVGSIPFCILLIKNKDLQINLLLKSLYQKDVFIYALILLFLHLVIWFINRYINPIRFQSNFLSNLHQITFQVGFSIHGIYRTIIGAMIIFVAYSFYKQGIQGFIQFLTIFILVIFLIIGAFFTKLSEKTAPK